MRKGVWFFAVSSWAVALSAAEVPFAGGSGVAADPYKIENVAQLQAIADFPDSDFVLTRDIDASLAGAGKGFTPIASPERRFEGSLDGKGHAISGLWIDAPNRDFVGLFSCVGTNGSVKDLRLLDIRVSANNVTGGLVGWNFGRISNARASGKIAGTDKTGGLVGQNYGEIDNSLATINVNGAGQGVGGLVGWNVARISKSRAAGDVVGMSMVGGLVGENYYGRVSLTCFEGQARGESYVGGLAGRNWGEISDSYSRGHVRGKEKIGGLVGAVQGGVIAKTYAACSVTRTAVERKTPTTKGKENPTLAAATVEDRSEDRGGLIGVEDSGYNNIYASFWDMDAAGLDKSAGGIGKTRAAMKAIDTYMGPGGQWDFQSGRIWGMNVRLNDGYPYLISVHANKNER